MQLALHESDKVSEEGNAPVSHKGACLEQVDGTDQGCFRHLLLPFARGQRLLQVANKSPLGPMGGATLLRRLCNILEGVLEGEEMVSR